MVINIINTNLKNNGDLLMKKILILLILMVLISSYFGSASANLSERENIHLDEQLETLEKNVQLHGALTVHLQLKLYIIFMKVEITLLIM